MLDNTAYVLGKPVSEFEAAFAKEHGVQYCYGVSSGTDGNHMVLWALGVGPGDEVIIPANTFIATAWGATLCGATPVFVDCEPDSYNIDPKKVEAKITPRTKAIVAVHLYGQSADMDPLNEIAKKHRCARWWKIARNRTLRNTRESGRAAFHALRRTVSIPARTSVPTGRGGRWRRTMRSWPVCSK